MPDASPELILAYITTKDRAEALAIGRALVEQKLAACVNVWDGMESLYWWEGKIDSSKEAVLIAKTTASHLAALTRVVKAMHSYDVPCVLELRVGAGGNPDYLKWLRDNVSR